MWLLTSPTIAGAPYTRDPRMNRLSNLSADELRKLNGDLRDRLHHTPAYSSSEWALSRDLFEVNRAMGGK
jgi:hypothetical protein